MRNYTKPEMAKLNFMSLNDIAALEGFDNLTEVDVGTLAGEWASM